VHWFHVEPSLFSLSACVGQAICDRMRHYLHHNGTGLQKLAVIWKSLIHFSAAFIHCFWN